MNHSLHPEIVNHQLINLLYRSGSRRFSEVFVIDRMWVMVFYYFPPIFYIFFRGGKKLISVIFTNALLLLYFGPHQLSKYHNYINIGRIVFTLISDALWTFFFFIKNISAWIWKHLRRSIHSRHVRAICLWIQLKMNLFRLSGQK